MSTTNDQKIEQVVEGLTRVVINNIRDAVAASGRAINRSEYCYVGSEAHVTYLVLEIMRELNKQNVFVVQS